MAFLSLVDSSKKMKRLNVYLHGVIVTNGVEVPTGSDVVSIIPVSETTTAGASNSLHERANNVTIAARRNFVAMIGNASITHYCNSKLV